MPIIGARRSESQILEAILTSCPASTWTIMRRSNMSWEQLQTYLPRLVSRGLLTRSGSGWYLPTPKADKALLVIGALHDLLGVGRDT